MDGKKVLWRNVSALMQRDWGGENLTRLSKDAKFGPATSTRLKVQKTSVGLDVLEKLATAFKVEPWQLLVPDFDWDAPPVLRPPQEASTMDQMLLMLEKHRRLEGFDPTAKPDQRNKKGN